MLSHWHHYSVHKLLVLAINGSLGQSIGAHILLPALQLSHRTGRHSHSKGTAHHSTAQALNTVLNTELTHCGCLTANEQKATPLTLYLSTPLIRLYLVPSVHSSFQSWPVQPTRCELCATKLTIGSSQCPSDRWANVLSGRQASDWWGSGRSPVSKVCLMPESSVGIALT